MPWYESQLVGTIAGTVLGFLLSYIPTAIERRRVRRSLLTLLRAEISSATDYLREKIIDYRDALEMVSKGDVVELFYSERRLDEVFAANLLNMASIDPRQAGELFRFYQSVAKYRSLIRALSQTKLDPKDDNSDFCNELKRVIGFMESGIARGDALVTSLQ
jgi:hypothetical protein